MPATTHDFVLTQGRRHNDKKFVEQSDSHQSIPTQHGDHMMRSRLEALWAQRFERRGFIQAPFGVTRTPCYFYEPRGMKRWPAYPRGRHYRIDFVLVYEVKSIILDDEERSRATRWEWVSVKPTQDEGDLRHLVELVTFDSKHQRAFQCCGDPGGQGVRIVRWDVKARTCHVD